jgi:hypothetical protein
VTIKKIVDEFKDINYNYIIDTKFFTVKVSIKN